MKGPNYSHSFTFYTQYFFYIAAVNAAAAPGVQKWFTLYTVEQWKWYGNR
jgi:hypothetical protein